MKTCLILRRDYFVMIVERIFILKGFFKEI